MTKLVLQFRASRTPPAQTAPETVQQEVFDFLVFLKTRQAVRTEGRENLLVLAETAWAADWSTPEEEEAWETCQT